MVVWRVSVNLCKQRKLFWSKLDTSRKNYKKGELLSEVGLFVMAVWSLPSWFLISAHPHLLPTVTGSLLSVFLTYPFIMIPLGEASYQPYISYFMNQWACLKSCLTFPLVWYILCKIFLMLICSLGFSKAAVRGYLCFQRKVHTVRTTERFLCSPETLVHHSLPGSIKGETSLPGFHISIKKIICDPEDLSQRHLVITEVPHSWPVCLEFKWTGLSGLSQKLHLLRKW